MSIAERANEIIDLYRQFGQADYIGEPVSQIEHMSQAAQLAMRESYDDEVVLAAFFHDIGHLCVAKNKENDLVGLGIKNHEQVGAHYLRIMGFPEKVTSLVESHVRAKRYLCFIDPGYYNRLSEASKKTLDLQGGVMTKEEGVEFEKHPYSELMVKMRIWDDLAKETGVPVIDFRIIYDKILTVLD